MQIALSPVLRMCLFTISFLFALSEITLAQVTSDNTVGTQVEQNGSIAEITGGETRGDNLFHSFEDFSVPTSNQAFFNNANDISNIFSRVTGGNISDIDGAIRANGSANLFLINPAGIVFGQNAQILVGGSFYGSTATNILFEDGEFSAADIDNPPLLTVNAPIGLSFRDNPADIVNRSFAPNILGEFVGLEIISQNNLALVGGNINFEGGIATNEGGNIELGGLSEAGTVGINENGSLSFPENTAKSDVSLTNFADVNVIGNDGGSIAIAARDLNLSSGEFGGSTIRAGINGSTLDAQAGDITINTSRNINLDNSFIANLVFSGAVGNSGNIKIDTNSLEATNGGQILTLTSGSGDAGSIEITARDNLVFDGENDINVSSAVFNSVNSGAVGNAGEINISARNLALTNGGRVQSGTRSQGDSGLVDINIAEDIVIDGTSSIFGGSSGIANQVDFDAIGNSEGINISTANLTLTNSGSISSGTRGQGNAGSIDIVATENVIVDGSIPEEIGDRGGITSVSDSFTATNAGGINISATNLSIINGGEIDSGTRSDGIAGDININTTESIVISGVGGTSDPPLFRSRLDANTIIGDGIGGDINLITDRLIIDEGTIEASNFDSTGIFRGTGEPGNINIEANSINLSGEGRISTATQSETGVGGIVNLRVADDITLRDDSIISARAFNDADGGNLNIDTNFIVAFPDGNSDIVASAEQGQGGNISINAESVFGIEERPLDEATNDINASSEVFGLEGNVTLETIDFNPLQGVIEVVERIIAQPETTAQACNSNREAAAANGLNIGGKGGVPPAPDLPLISEVVLNNNDEVPELPQAISTSIGKIQPARGIEVTENGIKLTAYQTDNAGQRVPQTKANCGV